MVGLSPYMSALHVDLHLRYLPVLMVVTAFRLQLQW